MADPADIAQIDPVLELTIDPASLECKGRLDVSTRRHVLDAVTVILEGNPSSIDVDVSGLCIDDSDGANALVAMQRMARDAGVTLHWRGLDKHALAVLH